ncbi:protein-tyrosine phosphatase family protein [Paenibacillus alginolyticus]|uniref:Dual specificity protein phosphatase family protein n=1 Tax=Paenibacillus alginolyticus TaxID=59839 RepID=A0ABT4G7R2_9BACL|nr:dual specificity protein phosphatase family protein [Paenibacillus alginolyticus]MCY9692221.1 dual specificity protein phosphatase family protein [Paenibacillus alginolyticus]MEC0145940.1 dual specificity protein phosphatase family protein [Paenibacillus alginolyticus]
MPNNYQSLHENKIFFGGAADVEDMVKNEGVEVIVDLRGEATECAFPSPNVQWIQVPLGDNSEEPEEQLFQQAISHVIEAYKSGKKVGFHCGGGKGRTGTVAVGTLLTLGRAQSIEEAEELAKSIRPVVSVKAPQRESLERIFSK